MASVAGREAEPAGRVFKNIRFLLVMNLGISQGLGVKCEHCHLLNDFASDTKRPKLAAREMAIMLRQIAERLENMTSLATPPDGRGIDCSTCRRGNVVPRVNPHSDALRRPCLIALSAVFPPATLGQA